VIDELSADGKLIRDVTLRRGLNVIHTAERERSEERVVGHSVGKTLFLRLIRYCLGEATFCTREVKSAITLKMHEAYVLAEVHIQGKPWVVARPMGMNPPSSSWAASGNDFSVFFGDRDQLPAFADFVGILEGTVRAPFEKMRLPNAGRDGRWLDLLGWLSRDQSCRYRHHNEWRSPETESGTAQLKREDASLLIRMVMDLLDDEERELMASHATLKREQAELEERHRRLEAFLELTEKELTQAIGLSDPPKGAMFGTFAANAANDKMKQLERLALEIDADGKIAKLDEQRVAAAQAVAVAEQELKRLRGLETASGAEVKQIEQASTAEYYASFDQQAGWCRLFVKKDDALTAGCPGTGDLLKPGERDPRHTARIEECHRHLITLAGEISSVEVAQTVRSKLLETATQTHLNAQGDRDRILRGMGEKVGSYRELGKRADGYSKGWDTIGKLEGDLEKKAKALTESLESQRDSRNALQKRKSQLTGYFGDVLRRVLGPSAGGVIEIDANGIYPRPNDAVAASGEAMGTSATVLGFDMACLIASIFGIGHLPRLLIHDSPREADMEEPMYHALFRLVAELEARFEGREPSFQYIVTTTTQPPEELAREPYLRLRLDARRAEELLLGVRF
jgi:multidrug efflux pump subunit AcrA (membrane-fusion protein)